MTDLQDLTWEDIIPTGKYSNKTVAEAIEKDGKNAIITLLKNEIPLSDDVIGGAGIHRTVHEATILQYIIDPEERKKLKDNKVYKKDTASREKILKEILTLEKEEPEIIYKETKEDEDLVSAAENVIDESTENA